jgi:hypothetical protein
MSNKSLDASGGSVFLNLLISEAGYDTPAGVSSCVAKLLTSNYSACREDHLIDRFGFLRALKIRH